MGMKDEKEVINHFYVRSFFGHNPGRDCRLKE
jgi:hypothetical protein